jgi:hypothetical protein
MASKPEQVAHDIETTELHPEYADEAALALKKIASSDMAPITEEENRKVLRKVDLWLMPIVALIHYQSLIDVDGSYLCASVL